MRGKPAHRVRLATAALLVSLSGGAAAAGEAGNSYGLTAECQLAYLGIPDSTGALVVVGTAASSGAEPAVSTSVTCVVRHYQWWATPPDDYEEWTTSSRTLGPVAVTVMSDEDGNYPWPDYLVCTSATAKFMDGHTLALAETCCDTLVWTTTDRSTSCVTDVGAGVWRRQTTAATRTGVLPEATGER